MLGAADMPIGCALIFCIRHSGLPPISGLPEIGKLFSKPAIADLDGGKSGIHNHRSANMDSGLAAFGRAPE